METRRPAVDRARRRVVRKGGQGRRRGSAGAYRPRSIQRIFRVSSARDLARADIAMGLPESLQLFDETPVKGATKKISRRFRGSQVRRGLAAGGRWIRTIGPRHERAGFCCGRRIAGPNGGSQKGLSLMRYRWFESISLQRRESHKPSVPRARPRHVGPRPASWENTGKLSILALGRPNFSSKARVRSEPYSQNSLRSGTGK